MAASSLRITNLTKLVAVKSTQVESVATCKWRSNFLTVFVKKVQIFENLRSSSAAVEVKYFLLDLSSHLSNSRASHAQEAVCLLSRCLLPAQNMCGSLRTQWPPWKCSVLFASWSKSLVRTQSVLQVIHFIQLLHRNWCVNYFQKTFDYSWLPHVYSFIRRGFLAQIGWPVLYMK